MRERSGGEKTPVPDVQGRLEAVPIYNDDWRGWPILPLHRQHPIRGSFLDPRAHDQLGAVYHDGVDIAVRDDRPDRGAPAGRTHRVHAIEGGRVTRATPQGVRGLIDIAHFRYEHVDALVRVGELVQPGQQIAWAWNGDWHVHLGELLDLPDGRRAFVNPLRPGGKLAPYLDTARPAVEEVRFYTPASPPWGRRPVNVARYTQAAEGSTRRGSRERSTARPDSRPAIFHRLVQSQAMVGRAAPPVPRRGQPRPTWDRPRLPRPRRLSLRTDAGTAGRTTLRPRHRAKPLRRRLHAPPRIASLPRRLLVQALPPPLPRHPAAPERALPDQHQRLGRSRQQPRRQHRVTVRN